MPVVVPDLAFWVQIETGRQNICPNPIYSLTYTEKGHQIFLKKVITTNKGTPSGATMVD